MNTSTDASKPTSKNSSEKSLQSILQSAPKSSSRSLRFVLSGVGLLAAGLAFYAYSGNSTPQVSYVSSEASKGKLVVTVSASGTLQPTKSVDVGSELSGTLESVFVQENEQVKKGQVLAQLDLSKLKDQFVKSEAAVAVADANVALMQATVAEAQANLARLRHVAELSGGKVPSLSELDTAEAVLQRAKANETSARAAVTQARATLKSDTTNVNKATIRSPVDGVVLTRKVEPGQTVAAAMTIPVLFSIAEDLTQMELQIKVDEADVGNVKAGQPASFTVSAWPGRKFPATLQRIGIGSTTTDNVVTYKTILGLSNKDLALRPGMTATAEIVTANRDDVLLVPNAALRFTPAQSNTAAKSTSLVSRLMPRPPSSEQRKTATTPSSAPQVWVLRDGLPQSVVVTPGVSNGRFTEILSGELQTGMAVITDYQEAAK